MYRTSVIFGVTGQIGSYLLDHLLNRGHRVIGAARRVSIPNVSRIARHLDNPNFKLVSCDITDLSSLLNLFDKISCAPHGVDVYNLAAQSFVAESFNQPSLTWDVTAKGHMNVLDCFRRLPFPYNDCRLFFMSSSETFGYNVDEGGFQKETTKMFANSPYGIAKLAAYNLNCIYRSAYDLNIRAGIIFNSESPRRGEEFVTRKITKWFGEYVANRFTFKEKLKLGNLDAHRDWTHATDTVSAIYAIMQNDLAKDYVVSSGETRSICSFLHECYNFVNSINGCCKEPKHKLEELYEIDSSLYRPIEVPLLKGDSSKIRTELGWQPNISFKHLVEEMVMSDIGNAYAKVKT